MVNKLPDVGRIQGLALLGDRTPKGSGLSLQYTDREGGWHDLTMSFLDGMYLLNLLKAVQLDVGFAMPEDPHPPREGPPRRPG